MANTVQVTFGANIQPLVDGVKDARSAIETFMAAFAVDKIASFVEQYAKLGEQIEAQSHQFGASTLAVQQLGYVAKMAGGDQQGLATSLGRLEQTLQQAQNPTSRQALALNALGLSAKQLIGLPLQQQLGIVADAMAKYADGTNKAAIAQALFRNSSGEFIAILDGGSAGLQRLYQQAIDTGAVLSGPTVKSLADLDQATLAAKAGFSGLAGTLLGELAGSLTNGIKSVTDFAASITLALDAGKFWQEQIDGLEYAMGSLALSVAHAAQIAADFFKMDWSAVKSDWARAEVEQQELLRQHEAQMAAIAAAGKAEIAKQMAPSDSGKLPPPAMNVNAGNALAEQKSAIAEQIKSVDDYFATVKEHLSAELSQHKITVDQETAQLIAAIQQRDTSEQTWYNSEIALVKAAGKNWEDVEKQRVAAHDKAMLEIQKATDEAVKKDAQEWQSALQPFVSAFDSQIKSLLARTETWGQAMKKIFADFVLDAIKNLEKLAVEKAASGLASAVGGGPQSIITSLLGGGGQAAATTANTAALTALTAAITGNTAAVATETVTTSTEAAAGAAGGGSGILSGLSSLLSMFAIPGFAVGSDLITRSGLAVVHAGNTITPARSAGSFTGAGMGGGGMSGKMFGRMMDAHEQALSTITARHASAMSSFEDTLRQVSRRLR